MNNWIGPTVCIVDMHELHNTTAYHLDRYNLHLLLLKGSMDRVGSVWEGESERGACKGMCWFRKGTCKCIKRNYCLLVNTNEGLCERVTLSRWVREECQNENDTRKIKSKILVEWVWQIDSKREIEIVGDTESESDCMFTYDGQCRQIPVWPDWAIFESSWWKKF